MMIKKAFIDKSALRDADVRDLYAQLQSAGPMTGDEFERVATSCTTMDAYELRALFAELLAVHDEPLHALLGDIRDRLLRHEESTQSAIYDLQDGLALQSAHLGKCNTEDSRRQFVRQVRETVRALLPPAARVIIASQGDAELLRLYSLRASPFPQGADGRYYPHGFANAGTAILHLEALRALGAQYLVLPGPMLSILVDFPEFKNHLDARFRLLANEAVCCIYSLREAPLASSTPLPARIGKFLAACEYLLKRSPSVLDWQSGLDLEGKFPQHILFSAPNAGASLPYMSESVDIVVLPSTELNAIAEARRVASTAVIAIADHGQADGDALTFEWKVPEAIHSMPSVSIILHAFGDTAITEATLRAVIETLPSKFQGDIVIVDDAGDAKAARDLRRLADSDIRIKLLRNVQPSGFAASCNLAVHAVQSEIVIFVQSGTVPMPGWLHALHETFRIFPDAGAVGGKIVSADGSLMQAGGVLFDDGTVVHHGAGEYNVDAPSHRHVRPVDFCSSDLLAVKRYLFEGEGGFDIKCSEPSLRDADFGLYLKGKGHRVYFQPECVVIRLTSSVENCRTAEKLLNCQASFVRKWGALLNTGAMQRGISTRKGIYATAIGQLKSGVNHGT